MSRKLRLRVTKTKHCATETFVNMTSTCIRSFRRCAFIGKGCQKFSSLSRLAIISSVCFGSPGRYLVGWSLAGNGRPTSKWAAKADSLMNTMHNILAMCTCQCLPTISLAACIQPPLTAASFSQKTSVCKTASWRRPPKFTDSNSKKSDTFWCCGDYKGNLLLCH